MPSPFNLPEENRSTSNYFTQFVNKPHTVRRRKNRKASRKSTRKNRKASRKN